MKMEHKKIAVFLPYANPHVMGWITSLRAYDDLIIGIRSSVKEYRSGYFDGQDHLENVYYFFKENHKARFYKELKNADVLITLGLFDPELFKIRLSAPNISSIYILSEPYNPLSATESLLKRRLFSWAFRRFYSNVNFLCIGGVDVKHYYQTLGFKKSKYYNFGYFPELVTSQKPAKTATRDNYHLRFLFVGQLIERKGIAALLRAIHQLSNQTYQQDWRLDIVGNGELRNEVEQLAAQYENVRFHGLVTDTSAINSFHKQADVLIVPSLFDGWAAVVNEGISKACAIVARNKVYATVSLVENNKNGFIFVKDNQLLPSLAKYLDGSIDLKAHQQHSQKVFEEWNHKNAAVSIHQLIHDKSRSNKNLLIEL